VQEQPPLVAGDRDVVAVRKAEDDVASTRVESDDAIGEAAGVDDSVYHRRRARDTATDPASPENPAARGGDGVEPTPVGAEVDATGPRGGSRVEVAAGGNAPEPAARGRERDECARVSGGRVHAPVGDRRRPVHGTAGRGGETELPAFRGEREKAPAVVADVQRASRDRRARGDLAAALVAPPQTPRAEVEGVDRPAPVAE